LAVSAAGLREGQRGWEHYRETGTRADYVAILERADQGIGRILDALDRLKLARNTLVIFTSDNGGEWHSRNAPLFHRKSTLWEGGIRVPLLMRWLARLGASVTSSQVGITMDLTASIRAAAGVERPAGYRPEGVDLVGPLQKGRLWERTPISACRAPNRCCGASCAFVVNFQQCVTGSTSTRSL
jgi:arylsulfatase A-like enzyme